MTEIGNREKVTEFRNINDGYESSKQWQLASTLVRVLFDIQCEQRLTLNLDNSDVVLQHYHSDLLHDGVMVARMRENSTATWLLRPTGTDFILGKPEDPDQPDYYEDMIRRSSAQVTVQRCNGDSYKMKVDWVR